MRFWALSILTIESLDLRWCQLKGVSWNKKIHHFLMIKKQCKFTPNLAVLATVDILKGMRCSVSTAAGHTLKNYHELKMGGPRVVQLPKIKKLYTTNSISKPFVSSKLFKMCSPKLSILHRSSGSFSQVANGIGSPWLTAIGWLDLPRHGTAARRSRQGTQVVAHHLTEAAASTKQQRSPATGLPVLDGGLQEFVQTVVGGLVSFTDLQCRSRKANSNTRGKATSR